MKKFLFFDPINVEGPKKKVLEFNQELNLLNEAELVLLDSFLDLIKNKQFYHSSKLSKQGWDLLKKLLKFPADKAFPCLDLYRMFLLHPNSSEHFKVFEYGLEILQILVSFLKDSPVTTQMMALRCLANLFSNTSSRYMLQSKRQFVIDHISHYLVSDNKQLRHAAITIILK